MYVKEYDPVNVYGNFNDVFYEIVEGDKGKELELTFSVEVDNFAEGIDPDWSDEQLEDYLRGELNEVGLDFAEGVVDTFKDFLLSKQEGEKYGEEFAKEFGEKFVPYWSKIDMDDFVKITIFIVNPVGVTLDYPIS